MTTETDNSATDNSATVTKLLDELGEVAATIRRAEEEARAAYEVRLGLYRRLSEEGVTQARMAAVAGVTHLAVSAALRKAARQDEAASKS